MFPITWARFSKLTYDFLSLINIEVCQFTFFNICSDLNKPLSTVGMNHGGSSYENIKQLEIVRPIYYVGESLKMNHFSVGNSIFSITNGFQYESPRKEEMRK